MVCPRTFGFKLPAPVSMQGLQAILGIVISEALCFCLETSAVL